MDLKVPEYELFDAETTKEMLQLFDGERDGWVKVGEKKYSLPRKYIEEAEGYYKFKARPDDTWVVTYPRSGTTWTQELVWLLSNNLDYETASKEYLADRFPFFEIGLLFHPEKTKELVKMSEGIQDVCTKMGAPGYEVLSKLPSPRFIKTHFPLSLLPGILDVGCKVVYVARNPKDLAVSYYRLSSSIKCVDFRGSFKQFWEYFRNDLTNWSPYWEHLKEAWAQRHHPNLLFIFYEEMRQNYLHSIKKVSEFLGKKYTDEEIKQLSEYLDIKNFRNNPMVNYSELEACQMIDSGIFVRQGQNGAWTNTFTPEMEADADAWIQENLKGTDLAFPCVSKN